MSFESFDDRGRLSYDIIRIRMLLSGQASPRDADDRALLAFIGSVRPNPWPRKSVDCLLCNTRFYAEGFPAFGGRWQFASVCDGCADRWDAGIHSAHPVAYRRNNDKKVRPTSADP